ncbi:nuclear transport factor 2 family protein [Geothrix sp. 21YS21S-4]|uniref:nuclear transport factor 2 family protein n=1 Tax=Geothrix sp. 21YS21S-4 TaxID=3068889 RepID=UPI0027BA57C3|nr:nuclear transport factor 2 family protein [Geothrix sp. 21YS21S-4]
MTEKLPPSIERYFSGKNTGDFAAAASAFSESASVKDEGQSHEGRAAIRAWMEETSRKYRDTAEIQDVAMDGAAVQVTALVSGTFPGSPVPLRFKFTLDGSRIGRLEIAS